VTPGIEQQTNYLQGGGFIEYDWRDNPGDSTSGGRYYAEYSKFSDRDFGLYSFYRVKYDVREFIPLFHGKRVIALHVATLLSDTKSSQQVPFSRLGQPLGSRSLFEDTRSDHPNDTNCGASYEACRYSRPGRTIPMRNRSIRWTPSWESPVTNNRRSGLYSEEFAPPVQDVEADALAGGFI
jgi:hypothetical protein